MLDFLKSLIVAVLMFLGIQSPQPQLAGGATPTVSVASTSAMPSRTPTESPGGEAQSSPAAPDTSSTIPQSAGDLKNNDQQIRELLQAQQQALEKASQEIALLKARQNETRKVQPSPVASKTPVEPEERHLSITAGDIDPYLTAVVFLKCVQTGGDPIGGSGFLWRSPSGEYQVLTNRHVAVEKFCLTRVSEKSGELYALYETSVSYGYMGSAKDFAILKLGNVIVNEKNPASSLNYKLTDLRLCPTEMAVGSPVVVIGYPLSTYTTNTVFVPGEGPHDVTVAPRTVTNGIISAIDPSVTDPYAGGTEKYHNFFTSAKIDSGNSGGLALSKDASGLCILGIPTWVSVGNYDSQGMVQNIHNLLE